MPSDKGRQDPPSALTHPLQAYEGTIKAALAIRMPTILPRNNEAKAHQYAEAACDRSHLERIDNGKQKSLAVKHLEQEENLDYLT